MPDLLARNLRNNATDAEKKLWLILKHFRHHGFHFRRQVRIGDYVADFLTFGARLIVELDGDQHAEENARRYDDKRTAFLDAEGFQVLRFWNYEVFEDADGVARSIDAALLARAPFQHATGADRAEIVAPITPKPSRSREARKLPRRCATPTPNPSPQGGGGRA
jgi:very-short-patch-repair endonuclease